MPKIPKTKSKAEKIIIFLFVISISIIVIYIGAVVGVATDGNIDETGKIDFQNIKVDEYMNQPKAVISNLTNNIGNARKGAMIAGLIAFIVCFGFKNNKRYHRKGEEHGSARWARANETLALKYKISKKEKQYELIPAKTLHKKNNKPVYFKVDKNFMLAENVYLGMATWQHNLNLNVLCCGGTGSGKTYRLVKPNLMQANCSYIITDPKGEILASCGRFLEEAGYDVKVFNLIDTKHSFNYNPFAYVYNENGDVDAQYVIKMIEVFMTNTTKDGGSGGDQFWEDSAKSLFTALAFLLLEEYSKDRCNFSEMTKLLKKFSVDMKDNNHVSELDELFYAVKEKNPTSLAVLNYTDFKKAAPETAMSIVMSCNVRLQKFNIPQIANLTHKDTLDLSMFGDRKTALFIIISVTDKSLNFLAAMLYTQMFDSLYNRANFVYNNEGLPIHVRCILDEFKNVGRIPSFGELLATMRGMNISATIILQNLAQLKEMYEKGWEDIKGNCSSFVFLGGQETSTAEEITKTLGKETIDLTGKNRTKGRQSSTSENNSILGRDLLTPDEVIKINKRDCIVTIQYNNPYYGRKIESKHHRHWKFLGDKKNGLLYDIKNVITEIPKNNDTENKGILTLKSLSKSHKSAEETDDAVKDVIKVDIDDKGTKTVINGNNQITSQVHPEINLNDEFDETEVSDNIEKNFPENCNFTNVAFDEIASMGFSYSLNNAKGVDVNDAEFGGDFEEDDNIDESKNFVNEEFQVSEEIPETNNYLVQSQNAELLFGDDDENESY